MAASRNFHVDEPAMGGHGIAPEHIAGRPGDVRDRPRREDNGIQTAESPRNRALQTSDALIAALTTPYV